jgi:tetratricopeptide (TPR) repeat protein
MKDFNKALELDSENQKILLERASLFKDRNDYQGVVRDCTALIDLKTKFSKAYYLRGMAFKYLSYSERDREREHLERAQADLTVALSMSDFPKDDRDDVTYTLKDIATRLQYLQPKPAPPRKPPSR